MDKALLIPMMVYGIGTVISFFVVLIIKGIVSSLKLFSKSEPGA